MLLLPSPPDSSVTATPSTVLNVFPYSNFTLYCNVTLFPVGTNPSTTSYQWMGEGVMTMNDSNLPVQLPSSVSDGTFTYQCSATVTVSGMSTQTIASDTVTVRGESS